MTRFAVDDAEDNVQPRMTQTFVLRETADDWRIAAIRNMLPAQASTR